MDWNAVVENVGSAYAAGFGLSVVYFFSKSHILMSRKDAALPAPRSERLRRYARAITLVVLLGGFAAFAFDGGTGDDDESDDQQAPITSPWQRFSTVVLMLVPVMLLGLSEGFRVDSKRTPRQRVASSLDDDDLRHRPDLVPVGDSNMPVYALCCVFNPGFAEGSRQDFMDLVVQKAGRPKPDDAEWLDRVVLDEDLRRSLYDMAAENASFMTDDAKALLWLGLTSAIMDQEFEREIKTSARSRIKG